MLAIFSDSVKHFPVVLFSAVCIDEVPGVVDFATPRFDYIVGSVIKKASSQLHLSSYVFDFD